jgi:tetratricopeptide (TPR) repeat protein
MMPMATPTSDMGMVLPITKAVGFLEALKAGQVKWNGVLDFSLSETLKKINEKARQGRWAEAMAMADEELKLRLQPHLFMAAGIMHFCAGDNQDARRLFGQALSMDAENQQARLMLFMIDWLSGDSQGSAHRDGLLALDWRSMAEFQGYLARVLEGSIDEASAIIGWDTEAEKSWLHYVVGLIKFKEGKLEESERLMRKAVLAADGDAWEFFLARAKLEELQKKRRESLPSKDQWSEYRADIEAFEEAVKKALEAKKERKSKAEPFLTKIEDNSADIKEKVQALEKLHELNPDERDLLVKLAFYSAMDEAWPQALEYVRTFLEREGRQNANRLSVGLLEPGILHYQGLNEKTQPALEAFAKRTWDPWYLDISEFLQGKQTEDSLKEKAGQNPENLLTAHTTLGFWAEGSGDKKKAIKHYKVALESFLDTWLEYDFAKDRMNKSKQPSK